MLRKRYIFLVLVFIIFFFNYCRRYSQPNIVIVLIDCLRADYLEEYGFKENRAPFLKSLQHNSVCFEKAFAASSWTAPSTASMFSALFPFQHGVTMGLMAQMKIIEIDPSIRINRIPDAVQTLPEILKKVGYSTWGFSDNSNISPKQGFGQGFDLLNYQSKQGADFINDQILKQSERIKKNSPYFLYIHYNDLHMPYKLELSEQEQTGNRIQDLKKRYLLELSFVDSKIRQLFEHFGWEKDTLFILIADHGEEFNEKGMVGHGKSLYNSVIHIPFFIYYPQHHLFQKKRIGNYVSNVDILPTLADFLGIKTPANVSGKSLLPLIKGKEPQEKRFILSHLHLKRANNDDLIIKAVIYNKFKYIYKFPSEELFYNIMTDFNEERNIINEARNLALKLKAYYFKFEKSAPRFNPDYVGITLDQKALQELKTLGYLQ